MLFASYVMLERVTSFNRLALRHVLPSLMRFADPCSVHMSIHCSIVQPDLKHLRCNGLYSSLAE